MSHFIPPGECPVCGAEVPARARSCPECGASASDGWSEETTLDGLDLPGEDSEQESAGKSKPAPSLAFNALVVAILILVFSGLWFLF